MKKRLLLASLIALASVGAITSCGSSSADDKYDASGKLILNLKNLYFSDWAGGDAYTQAIEDKFQVSINPSSYSYADWGSQVSGAVNSLNLTDVFHFNLESFNYGNTYEKWAKGDVIKALPDDLSAYPNIQKMMNGVSNLDALKINGKLYGIPLTYDISNPVKDFSSFTYVYRRDWAKAIDAAHASDPTWTKVYKEGDVYTWEEFNRLVKAFDSYNSSDSYYAMADVEWGFPSITNFFKDSPHCYSQDASGVVSNAYTTNAYVEGLEVAKDFVTKKYYGYDQYSANDGDTSKQYKSGRCGIYYENLSLSNYITLRKEFKKNQKMVDLDDGTAILKVKGPDGKFALEGTDNWFSITLFNYEISDNKMNKILEMIDWLLGEEGTRMAVYGIEGYDYNIVNDGVVLSSTGWEIDPTTGEYIEKTNGAKYLRYLATLGNDTKSYDPLTDARSYKIIDDWQKEMAAAKASGDLRIIKESSEVKWLSTPLKNSNTSGMLSDANDNVVKYCYGASGFGTIQNYKDSMDKSNIWKSTLAEINQYLGH